MKTKRTVTAAFALLAIPALVACTGGSPTAAPSATPSVSASAASATASPVGVTASAATDYSVAAHWLALPKSLDKPVDVFYLSPTEYRRASASDPIVGPVDDPATMLAMQSAYSRQATAFSTVGNIYAPYYRQADAVSRASLPQAAQDAIVAGGPTEDGIAAFDYYVQHYNDGRPFILAGHSLGSNVLANLLAQYMPAHPDVYKRMVVAYVVGYSITPTYLAENPELKFAGGPDDTGVIASWNTEAPTIGGTNPVLLPGGLEINPISWTRTETPATAAQNLGSIALNKNGTPILNASGTIDPLLNFADARIDLAKGVVICSTVPVDVYSPGNALLPKGIYHTFDYPFFYFDVRANAANRVARYLATA